MGRSSQALQICTMWGVCSRLWAISVGGGCVWRGSSAGNCQPGAVANVMRARAANSGRRPVSDVRPLWREGDRWHGASSWQREQWAACSGFSLLARAWAEWRARGAYSVRSARWVRRAVATCRGQGTTLSGRQAAGGEGQTAQMATSGGGGLFVGWTDYNKHPATGRSLAAQLQACARAVCTV